MGQCLLAAKGGGSGMKATLLWTNPNQTSAQGDKTYTLPNYSGYDYLLVEVKQSTTSSKIAKYFIDISLLKNSFNYSLTDGNAYITQCNSRTLIYVSDTQVRITTCSKISEAGYGNELYAIPLKIYGIKGNIKGV